MVEIGDRGRGKEKGVREEAERRTVKGLHGARVLADVPLAP